MCVHDKIILRKIIKYKAFPIIYYMGRKVNTFPWIVCSERKHLPQGKNNVYYGLCGLLIFVRFILVMFKE